MNIDEIKNMANLTIDQMVNGILQHKPVDKQYLNAQDIDYLGHQIEGFCVCNYGTVPRQVQSAILMGKAVIANDFGTKVSLAKQVIGIAGSAAGLYAILTGVATILGWGSGVVTSVVAFFCGVSMSGPLGIIAIGSAAMALAGYLMFTNIPEEVLSRKAVETIRESIINSLPEMMAELPQNH